MRTRLWATSSVIFLLGAMGASAQQSQPAQSQTQTQTVGDQKAQVVTATTPPAPSIADAARKAREQKKSEPKSAMVFTNDNIPAAGGINVVGDTTAPAPGGAAPAPAAANDEKMWRAGFATARTKLQRDQADLDVMQRELGKLDVQYYPNDPTKQLMQSVTFADINDKRAKIAQKQQQIAQDQAAISYLEDQLRKSGGDPGWAR